jgi:hypothetical protein
MRFYCLVLLENCVIIVIDNRQTDGQNGGWMADST